MPPKRKAPTATEAGASEPKKRQSKLAKEHNITPQEEAEIREAFGLFSEPMEGEKEGVLAIGDVRRAMIALGIPPASRAELSEFTSILDPDDEGFAPFAPFVAICALKLHAREHDSDAHRAEVAEAFALFAGDSAAAAAAAEEEEGGGGGGGVIRLSHLRRVAATLKLDVADDLLRDMILEANGGAGVGQGVKREEFEVMMRRAGVWR